MSGNCATGRLRYETMPIIVMMIAMTIATMGRLMKKRAMVCGLLRCGFRRCVRRRCPRLGRHGCSGAQLLETFHHHFFAGLQARRDGPFTAKARPYRDSANLRLIVRAD